MYFGNFATRRKTEITQGISFMKTNFLVHFFYILYKLPSLPILRSCVVTVPEIVHEDINCKAPVYIIFFIPR